MKMWSLRGHRRWASLRRQETSKTKRTSFTSLTSPLTHSALSTCSAPTPASPLKQPIKPPLRNGNDLSTSTSRPTYSQPNTCFRTCSNGGGGYLLNTASAAGLLVEPKAAPYTVTKHAAVGFAERLAVAYGYRGIRVSALCPAGVVAPLIDGNASLLADAITTSQLADIVVQAIDEERFMISTHGWVLDLLKLKGEDYPAYLRAMDQARQSFSEGQGAASPTTSGQR